MKSTYTQHEKAEFVARVDELMRFENLSQNAAAARVGVTGAQVLKWRRALLAGGVTALQNRYAACGRKPMYVPTEAESQALRELVLNTDPTSGARVNKILAAQLFARDERCSDALRAILENLGMSRRALPPTIAKAMHVRKSDKDLLRGGKRYALEGLVTPRELSYIDEMGAIQALMPGDLWESDDMHLNGMFWVPWESDTDKCATKFGCRVFRAQLLPFLDVATGGFVAYSLILRESDAYKAEDIRWALSHLFNTVGVPRTLRFEHGSWASNAVESIEKDIHVCRIVHAKTAKGKIIEGRFNVLQRVLAVNEIHLGRKRGEFEWANSQWMAYRNGVRDPRKEIPSLAEQVQRLDAAFAFVNNKPMNGELYGPDNAKKLHNLPYWIPQQIADKFYLDNPAPRKPELEEMLAVLPAARDVSIRNGLVRVKMEDFGGVYYFHSPEFARVGDGWPVRVCFDPTDPEMGAGILSQRDTDDARNLLNIKRGAFICRAAYVERVPQFAVGGGDTLGFDRAKRHAKLAHLLFREIVPAHRHRGVTVHEFRSGTSGERTEVRGLLPAQAPCPTVAPRRSAAEPAPSDRRGAAIDVEKLFTVE